MALTVFRMTVYIFFQAMAISNSLGHKGSQTQFYHCEVCEYVFPTFPFLNPSIEGWVYNIAKICPSFKPIRYIIHFKIRSSNIRNNYKKKSPGVDYESYFWQLSDALISTDVKWSQHLVWTLASFFRLCVNTAPYHVMELPAVTEVQSRLTLIKFTR